MTETKRGGEQVRVSSPSVARTWFSWRLALGALMGAAALCVALYVPFARWWNDREHAQALAELSAAVVVGPQERLDQIRQDAVQYNRTFLASGDNSDYLQQLDPTHDAMMGRIKIKKINVDLPIYHTSSDEVLRKGAGHMEETTLPVGGIGTHAAITAHRGLAESKLFTELDRVDVGDQFVLEILGEALAYEVKTVRIVAPTETEWLLVDPDKDLVTLITCDPLGINTERMLVTGERVYPAPVEVQQEVGEVSDLPGFPWWFVALVGGLTAIALLAWYTQRAARDQPAREAAGPTVAVDLKGDHDVSR